MRSEVNKAGEKGNCIILLLETSGKRIKQHNFICYRIFHCILKRTLQFLLEFLHV